MVESVESVENKSGENCIQTSIGRSSAGMVVNIWASPKVENFIRSLGSGEQVDVNIIGRFWEPLSSRNEAGKKVEGKKLLVYDLLQPMNFSLRESDPFRMDRPGYPLTWADPDEDGRPRLKIGGNRDVFNLSFLRLVGISEAGGVSFTMRGVYTREEVDKLGEKVGKITNLFYREFMKPYKLIITVSSMPIG